MHRNYSRSSHLLQTWYSRRCVGGLDVVWDIHPVLERKLPWGIVYIVVIIVARHGVLLWKSVEVTTMKQGHDENSIYIMASHVGASWTPWRTQHGTTTPLLQSTLSINSSGPNRFLFHLIEKVRGLCLVMEGGGTNKFLRMGQVGNNSTAKI